MVQLRLLDAASATLHSSFLALAELIRFKSERMNKRLDKRFTKLDANGDGFVTRDELQKKRKLRKGKKARMQRRARGV